MKNTTASFSRSSLVAVVLGLLMVAIYYVLKQFLPEVDSIFLWFVSLVFGLLILIVGMLWVTKI